MSSNVFLILLKLSFSSLVYLNNSVNSIILVFSRLEYCNAVLATTLAPLQRVLHAAAQLVTWPRYVGTQGAPLAADCSTNRVQTVPACPQVDCWSSASVYEKPSDCRRRCFIAVSALWCCEVELCHTEDSPQARGEGVFGRCSTSLESSSNRPQNVAFYSCIQALFEIFFVPDGIQCLISRPLHT